MAQNDDKNIQRSYQFYILVIIDRLCFTNYVNLRLVKILSLLYKFLQDPKIHLSQLPGKFPLSHLKIIPCPESETSNAACNPRVTSPHEIFSRQSNKSPIKYSTAVQVYTACVHRVTSSPLSPAPTAAPFPLVNKE